MATGEPRPHQRPLEFRARNALTDDDHPRDQRLTVAIALTGTHRKSSPSGARSAATLSMTLMG